MSTDHSSLPSVLDARSKWEQLASSTNSEEDGSKRPGPPSRMARSYDALAAAVSIEDDGSHRLNQKPSFSESSPNLLYGSTTLHGEDTDEDSSDEEEEDHAPLSPFQDPFTPPDPFNNSSNSSSGQISSIAKLKPPVAPKPARLSSNFAHLSLSDRDKLQSLNPHSSTNSLANLPSSSGHGSSGLLSPHSALSSGQITPDITFSPSSMMQPPPPPPPRPVSPCSLDAHAPNSKMPPPRPPPPRSPGVPAKRLSTLYRENSADAHHPPGDTPAPCQQYQPQPQRTASLTVPPPPPAPRRSITPPERLPSPAGGKSQNAPPPPPPRPLRRIPSSHSQPHLPLVSSSDSLQPPPKLPARNDDMQSLRSQQSAEDLRRIPSSTTIAPQAAPKLPPRPIASDIRPLPNDSLNHSVYAQNNASRTSLAYASDEDHHPHPASQSSYSLVDHPAEAVPAAQAAQAAQAIHTAAAHSPPSGMAQEEYPDSSQANRRAPIYDGVLHSITTKSEVKATSIHGRFLAVCAATTRVFDLQSGECVWTMTNLEVRVTAVAFKDTRPEDDGKVLWLGTKEGNIIEIHIDHPEMVVKRENCHLTPVVLIHKNRGEIWTLSDDGKLCIWNGEITGVPKIHRVTPNFKAFAANYDYLWVGRNRQVQVYQPSLAQNVPFALTAKPIPAYAGNPSARGATEFSCAGVHPGCPDLLFFGHEDGTITIYSQSRMVALESLNVSINKICAIRGVGHYLWIGLRTGNILVCDVSSRPWKVLKEWKAHDSPVSCIHCNDYTLQNGTLPIATFGTELSLCIWDGLLKQDWIEMDMHGHDEEFSTFRDIKVHLITWNAGAAKPSDLDRNKADSNFLRDTMRSHGEVPEVIVFGFQELVELDNTSVTAKSMFSKKKKKDKDISISSNISHQYKAWQDRLFFAVNDAFNERYKLVHSSNMVGLFTCVFLKESAVSHLRSIRSSSVKTGLGGLHGNKGGIAVRMMIDDSSLCFVNCHLAAGQSSSMQRNKDIESILETQFLDESDNAKFTGKGIFVNGGDGTKIMDHEICFFSGDMNYRINLQRLTAMKLLQENNLDKLLENDQLLQQRKKNPSMRLRAFQEAPILFMPTYKFDIGTDTYDSSEKKRVPAWCDRIYFRGGSRVTPLKYASHIVRVSDHRPVSGLYNVRVKTIDNAKRNETYKTCLTRWKVYLDQAVRASNAVRQ
ncbi:hypothetical protein TRVA0_003S03268 [Trichomonascus vanleenenianus]|uniref:uncharacterized protein n=1 Tax=Trichomonascus vanleenenianus TaxID=2268995 RepID=UPI003ECAE1C7